MNVTKFAAMGKNILYPVGRKINLRVGNANVFYKQTGKNIIEKIVERNDGTKIVGKFVNSGNNYELRSVTLKNNIGSIITKFKKLINGKLSKETTVRLSHANPELSTYARCNSDGLTKYYSGGTAMMNFSQDSAKNIFNNFFNKIVKKS